MRQPSVRTDMFTMVPRADVPRSAYRRDFSHKTAFDPAGLIPVFCDEVVPGDYFDVEMAVVGRLATPIFPFMDNIRFSSYFFFVPNRLVWDNWEKFMGAQVDPGDSIDYTIPTLTSPVGGYAVGSVFDHFGLPTVGQVEASSQVTHSALPLRGYMLIWNEWFRDEDVTDSYTLYTDDSTDGYNDYALFVKMKAKDYFTSCRPWPLKGYADETPYQATALVQYLGGLNTPGLVKNKATDGDVAGGPSALEVGTTGHFGVSGYGEVFYDPNGTLGVAVDELRMAFQTQRFLERDARGGTRYTELIRSHFGVTPPDFRLQRPEFIGGGTSFLNVSEVPYNAEGASAPVGTLAAKGTVVGTGHRARGAFAEHGYIIGLLVAYPDVTYQQGMARMWSRSTRYDFYDPAFAHLGEQAVLSKEIFCTGEAADDDVFGYQEHWAEMRYGRSMVTGIMRSTAASTLHNWHLAQEFSGRPTLNTTFMVVNETGIDRAIGAPSQPAIIADLFFRVKSVRPMPTFSVPGLSDHF